jgi:MFS family permease
MRLLTGQVGFVLVSVIALMNAVARTGALFSIVPVLANVRLGLGVGEIGVGLALGSVCGLIVAYPSGMLVDHFGRKAVIVPATAISGLSLLLFCWAPDYPWFIAACVAWGIASSIGGAAPAAYAADSAPAGMNAAAMSTFRLVSDAGYVIGPVALGLLADAVSPDASLIAGAALLVVFGLLFGRLAPETYRRAK